MNDLEEKDSTDLSLKGERDIECLREFKLRKENDWRKKSIPLKTES